jgi:2-polyprenyl-3-methyl-5-hydroxy-6-metoxy-1,4-benzoquinol methylase
VKLISNNYRTELRNYHKQEETWGVGPKWNIIRICKFLYDNNIESVLDYGCGKGWYLPLILPIHINNYDPAVLKWSIEPKPEDYLLCIDVLEHAEPEFLTNVIKHLVSKFNKKALLIISLQKARETLPSGRNAHLIVKPADWWVDLLGEYCSIEKVEHKDESRKGSQDHNDLLIILKK